jgi:hypothetical protein
MESITLQRLLIRDCTIGGSGTTRIGSFAYVFSPANVWRVDVENSFHNGNTHAVNLFTITNAPIVTMRGTKHAGVFAFSGAENMTLILDGIDIISVSGGLAFNFGGTSKTFNIYAKGIRNIGAVTLSTFGGTTPTFNLRESDGTWPADATKWTTITSGSIFYNTNAGYGTGIGLYAQGAAASTRIAA